MVTQILLDPRRDLPAGSTDSAAVIVQATPTGVREDGSVFVLPTTLSFTVNTAADAVTLSPPAASWAWRIVVRQLITIPPNPLLSGVGPTTAPGPVLQQRTVRFADVPSIAYSKLTDVDPASLASTASTARQWDATFSQLVLLLAQATPIRSTPPDHTLVVAYIDSSTVPPVLKGWNGTTWVALGGAAAAALATVLNSDGTFTTTGTGIVDNGDGTLTLTDSSVTDNGDGTFSLAA